MDSDRLSRARIRPARTDEDIDRAAEFLKSQRVREIAEGHPEERGAVRLCEVDDEIIAAILIDPTPLRVRETNIRCARLVETGGLDGRAEFRATGSRELFVLTIEEALGYIWIKRYPIAYAHGELAMFPAHGFVPCFYHPRVYVDVAAALALPMPYRVRHLKSEDIAAVQRLRSSNRDLKPTVFAAGVPPFHHFCVEDPKRKIQGYLSLRIKPESTWRPMLFAPEVEVCDRDAAYTVLRHCAEKAQEAGLTEMHFPLAAQHPVARICLELGGRAVIKGASSRSEVDEEMIHVVDPVRLFEAFEPYFQRRLAKAGALESVARIPLSSAGSAWMLRIDGGRVYLDELTQRPTDCIDLPRWAFAQLVTGYRSMDEIDVEVDPEHRAMLDMLLPKTHPYSLPNPDVWNDAATPPDPYSAEALKVVSQTKLPWARP